MKSFQIITAFMFLFAGVQTINAQTKSGGTKSTVKTSTFKVWGNCGMCKTTIEGAAKKSGATYASWNVDTKVMTVKYASRKWKARLIAVQTEPVLKKVVAAQR